MNTFYLILGAFLILLAALDLLWTILWVTGGAGPVTRRLTALSWKILRKISEGNSKFFSLAGPVTLLTTLLFWILTLWAGWTLLFAGGEIVLSDTQNRGAISWVDTIYFAGYSLFTLGIGDFVPINGFWKIATVLASASGMLFITMSASYVISVLSAVSQKRSFADSITGVGQTPVEVVEQAWNGKDFHDINLFLITYASQLSTMTAQHMAYPILHYYQSEKSKKAPTKAVAIFDEALTILKFGFGEKEQPNSLLLKNARSSVHSYISTLTEAYVKPADEVPPIPDLQVLRNAGLPITSDEKFAQEVSNLEERRRKLLGLIEGDARKWPS